MSPLGALGFGLNKFSSTSHYSSGRNFSYTSHCVMVHSTGVGLSLAQSEVVSFGMATQSTPANFVGSCCDEPRMDWYLSSWNPLVPKENYLGQFIKFQGSSLWELEGFKMKEGGLHWICCSYLAGSCCWAVVASFRLFLMKGFVIGKCTKDETCFVCMINALIFKLTWQVPV